MDAASLFKQLHGLNWMFEQLFASTEADSGIQSDLQKWYIGL